MLTDEEFESVRDYLADGAGLVFDDTRRGGLAAVIAERVAAAGTSDVDGYLRLLGTGRGQLERQRLLDAVTVQETFFFRNTPQMEALRRRVLPELLRRAAGRDRPLTIWSAGCSTGEEPYTLAMLLLELSPMLGHRPPARIVATDVSVAALDVARRGVYSGRSVESVPPMLRDRWFEPTGGGSLAVRDEVRRMVELQAHNLVADPAPFGPGDVDLIVCRNVTIYFARNTTRDLVGRFHGSLAEGGYLVLGHAETLWQVSDAFTLMPVGDAFVYRRSHSAGHSTGSPPPPEPGVLRRLLPARRPRPLQRSARPAGSRHRAAPREMADALAALAAGRYVEAAEAAERVVLAEPLRADGYVVLGQALTTLGRDGDALAPLRKAVYLAPGAGHAHFMLAGSLARLSQHGPAAVSYRAAAAALEAADPAGLAAFLDGRELSELVELCRILADMSEEAARDQARLTAERRGA